MILKKTPGETDKPKISFNPDLNNQAQEWIFSRKLNKPSHQIICQFFVLIGKTFRNAFR